MQAFSLSSDSDFDAWSKWKLSLYSGNRFGQLLEPVPVWANSRLQAEQLEMLRQNIREFNFSLYRVEAPSDFDLTALADFGQQLGLSELDANLCAEDDCMTILSDNTNSDESNRTRQRYIPYSNKALRWHTDGYYNPPHQRVRSFILHCVHPASAGGANHFIDPDIVYILLRLENPDFIKALSDPEVMRIPENRDDTGLLRPETATAVFQLSPDNVVLDMRYSQRKKNIIWPDDSLTREALARLNALLDSESKWQIKYRLKAGEGIVSNNVLHQRDAYQDDAANTRVYYRARYYHRVSES